MTLPGLFDVRIPIPGAARSGHGPQSARTFRLERLVAAAEPTGQTAPFTGVLIVEGEATGDGRMIMPNALRWGTLPLPLRYVQEDDGGHDGAQVVGQIQTVSREGDELRITGLFDLGSDVGREAARQCEAGLMNGISADLDDVSFEYRVAAELLQSEPMDDGALPVEQEQADADGRVTVARISSTDEVEVTTDARVRAGTMVSIPAFDRARIVMAGATEPPASGPASDGPPQGPDGPPPAPADTTPAEEPAAEDCPDGQHWDPTAGDGGDCVPDEAPVENADDTDDEEEMPETVTAALVASIPVEPPVAWFSNPRLRAATPMHVGRDGRVYGHIAEWNSCHVGFADACTTAPRSASGYAYFRTGAVLTAEGSEIAVGHLTMDTRHAGRNASPSATMRHYDHTGTAVADVAVGEDEFGIWCAGALRSTVTPEQVRALRSSPISGDWRRIGTSLELVAALAVNVPGFPVPRVSGLVAGAQMQTLVAAGMIAPRRVRRPGRPGALSADDLRYLKRLAARERTATVERITGMARSLRAEQLATRVRGN